MLNLYQKNMMLLLPYKNWCLYNATAYWFLGDKRSIETLSKF